MSQEKMKKFSHYEIDRVVYTGDKFIIYHARNTNNEKPVYLKALKVELPDLKDVARLQREYNLLSQLDAPEIIKCQEITKEGHRVAIVMEDIIDGVSLQEYCKSKACGTADFLHIAIQIVQGLIALHEKKIIHKDIKPSNILISKKNHLIKIIDFGISTQLSRENPEVASNNIMEGSLPYISPEQTGMVNLPLDYRTDFYSLGITFYEMLAQEYPLKGNNYKEWANAHISTEPKPLRNVNSKVPEVIADIVMRLIEKIPKKRYQNFSSLKKDLEECQRQFLKNSQIEKFVLSTNDLTDHFQVSDQLYGRDTEIQLLIDTFDSVAMGNRELLLVSGYSGSGKSTLVNEIKESILAKNGYFTAGKVDQYNQQIPYSAFIDAFKQITKYLFQKNDVAFAEITVELKKTLYPNEKILTSLIPELQKILGDSNTEKNLSFNQNNDLKLSSIEDENRFKLAIKHFIKVVAKRENPLVIFLDDFQWAGSPAFNLLQNIMLDDSIESLLIIGAYRDNEVNESHPLHFMINEINKVKPIKTIKLCPLEKTSIIQLVADTLHCTNKKALSLADILYKKAEGNPFFTTELLKNLHRERYIDFNYELGQWEWDITKIQSVDISDNVVEFMISRLQQLPDASRELLMKASCIGSQFDLNLLSHVVKRKPSSVAEDLHKPLRLGILMPMLSDYELAGFYEGKTNETNMKFHALYRFQHDRIQQAAYEMIPQKEKPSIHLLIGETLQESYHGKRMDGIIVSIADHMNKAISLITGETDKLKLAQLNLAAGIKAKASIAYRTAYELLKTGISLLGPENWNSHYQLSCDLYEQFSQSAFLCGEFSDAQNSNESLLQHVRTPLEKAKIYRLCALQFTINDKSEDALNASIKGLHLLGINVNKNSSSLSVLKQLLKTRFHQGFKSISSLADLPLMQDPKMIVCMQLLMEMTAPCYTLGHKNLFAEAILRQVGLAIRYGSTKEAPYAYATHGLLLNAIFNQPSSGFEFGKMAIKLNEKLGDISLRCRILFVYYSFIFPWNQPIHELYDIYEKLIMIGYQSGDLIYVTYTTHLCLMLPPKKSLGDTIKLGEKYIDMIRATKYGIGLIVLEVLQQFRLSLQDRKNHKFFEIDANSEVGFLTNIRATNYDALLTVYLVKKLSDCYIFSNYTHAYSILEEGEKSLEAMLSAVITEEFYLFATLTLAHCYPNANNHEKKKLLSQMSRYYKKIKSWSSRCEVNFLQHALLLEATIFRIKNKRKKAIAAYEKALAASQKNNFLHDEALICEEISHFYHDIIDSTKEHKYMHQAHYTYLKWGATAKVAQLQAAYPYLTPPVVKPSAAAAKLDDTITL